MLHVLDRHAIGQILRTKEVDAWGVAANEPRLPQAPDHPTAISILMRLDPLVVRGLRHGPTPGLPAGVPAREQRARRRHRYARRRAQGARPRRRARAGHHGARPTATSRSRTRRRPPQAGLGWIGKTALFVSPEFGPAVRLATVFTDLELPTGEPVTESRCGDCRACVDACPAGCGRDVLWRPGMARELLFDAGACRRHMTLFTERRGGDLRHLHRRLPVHDAALTGRPGASSGAGRAVPVRRRLRRRRLLARLRDAC